MAGEQATPGGVGPPPTLMSRNRGLLHGLLSGLLRCLLSGSLSGLQRHDGWMVHAGTSPSLVDPLFGAAHMIMSPGHSDAPCNQSGCRFCGAADAEKAPGPANPRCGAAVLLA
eukprot:CAMPEP_0202423502 /NCGR_PEP_ID=MMETSP1128-20130828/51412_1 /ASSEMBLY_ACC=CAM_ASM_000463 /TAXON_ID=3047 /ORGANISM="Dunaliella tertiolecta, Strain CCMP1320" /LENGTH=112 /DNA_ID=CAMNT_0049031613 /DNA_START=2700 /DNA_END=3038 /DNA_ORIENTATION=-